MNWIEKIATGMELIRQGCEDGGNGAFKDCLNCPFNRYCTILYDEYYPLTVEDLFSQKKED